MTGSPLALRGGTVVEWFSEGSVPGASADRLVIAPWIVAVVDGSTAKPWESPSALRGEDVATCVADGLMALEPALEPRAAVDALSASVASLGASADRDAPGGCATVAVVNLWRRELWRVGDPQVMVGGSPWPARTTGEMQIARRRAELLRAELRRGVPLGDLLRDDPGRAAVLGDLHQLVRTRNHDLVVGQAVIDGTRVPDALLEQRRLPDTGCEVVLASDGYPAVLGDLHATEQALQERIRRDPLMIGDPPATKGVAPGAVSFDDRTYVRLRVDGSHRPPSGPSGPRRDA